MNQEYNREKVLNFVRENHQKYFSKDAEGFFGIFSSCFTQDEEIFKTSHENLKLSWDVRKFMNDFCLKFFNDFNDFH